MQVIFETSATNEFKTRNVKPSKIVNEVRKIKGNFGKLKDGFDFIKKGNSIYIY